MHPGILRKPGLLISARRVAACSGRARSPPGQASAPVAVRSVRAKARQPLCAAAAISWPSKTQLHSDEVVVLRQT